MFIGYIYNRMSLRPCGQISVGGALTICGLPCKLLGQPLRKTLYYSTSNVMFRQGLLHGNPLPPRIGIFPNAMSIRPSQLLIIHQHQQPLESRRLHHPVQLIPNHVPDVDASAALDQILVSRFAHVEDGDGSFEAEILGRGAEETLLQILGHVGPTFGAVFFRDFVVEEAAL